MLLQVRSQIPLTETGGAHWMDDCGPTSLAIAIGWASKYAVFPTAQEGWAAAEKSGRKDRADKPDPTSFAVLIKAAKIFKAKTAYVQSCAGMLKQAHAGAAIILNIQASLKVIPAHALSVWQSKAFGKAAEGFSYGHYVVLARDETGWLYACPTMKEGRSGVRLTQPQVDKLALSKGQIVPPAIAVTFGVVK